MPDFSHLCWRERSLKSIPILIGLSLLLCACSTAKKDVSYNEETKPWAADLPEDDPARVETRARALVNSGQASDSKEAYRIAVSEQVVAAALDATVAAALDDVEEPPPEDQADMDQAFDDAVRDGLEAE